MKSGLSIIEATEKGDINRVKELIEAGVDLNVRNPENGQTPLIIAIYTPLVKEKIALMLLNENVNVNAVDNNNFTALHGAAFYQHTKLLKLLIEKKADLEIKDSSGSTAVSIAANRGNLDCLKILVEAGAITSNYPEKKFFFISMAANGYLDIIKYLIEEVHVTITKEDASKALIFATMRGNTETVRYLLTKEIDLNQLHEGEPVLHHAVYTNSEDILKLLLEAKPDINKKNNFGKTALEKATKLKYSTMIEILKKAGAK